MRILLYRVQSKSVIFSFLLFLLVNTGYANTAPQFTLPTSDTSISLSDLKGKVIYLDFWASWCTPCRKSFPWMNEMQERYGKNGLVVVAINLDKDKTALNKFRKKYPVDFIIAEDPNGDIAKQYKVLGMPSAYLISREGKIINSHIGFREKDKAKLEAKIKALLKL